MNCSASPRRSSRICIGSKAMSGACCTKRWICCWKSAAASVSLPSSETTTSATAGSVTGGPIR